MRSPPAAPTPARLYGGPARSGEGSFAASRETIGNRQGRTGPSGSSRDRAGRPPARGRDPSPTPPNPARGSARLTLRTASPHGAGPPARLDPSTGPVRRQAMSSLTSHTPGVLGPILAGALALVALLPPTARAGD